MHRIARVLIPAFILVVAGCDSNPSGPSIPAASATGPTTGTPAKPAAAPGKINAGATPVVAD